MSDVIGFGFGRRADGGKSLPPCAAPVKTPSCLTNLTRGCHLLKISQQLHSLLSHANLSQLRSKLVRALSTIQISIRQSNY